MKKRMTALLLVFALVLSCLSGCGSKKNSGEETSSYASATPLSFFDTLNGIRSLKDRAFEMKVSAVDGDGNIGELYYTASGVCYASAKQAQISLTDKDEKPITELYVDGNTLYVNVSELTDFCAADYENSEDSTELQEDIDGLKELHSNLPEYLSITLQEDIWTTLASDDLTQVKGFLKEVYESIAKDVSEKGKQDGSSVRTVVGGGDLQNQVLKVLTSFSKHDEEYQTVVNRYLTENYGDFIEACGRTPDDLVEQYWDTFDAYREDLEQMSAENTWYDWQVAANTSGDEEHGYTVDLTSTGDYNRHILLNVTPTEAETITFPEKAEDYQKHLDDFSYLYYVVLSVRESAVLRNIPISEEGELDFSEDEVFDTEAFAEGSEGDSFDEEAYTQKLDLIPISGYDRISEVLVSTEDGFETKVPVINDYLGAECSQSELSDAVVDIYSFTDGYTLNWYNIDATTRDPQEIVEETASEYMVIFADDDAYQNVSEPSKTSVSQDKGCAANGFTYHNADEDEDVTVINVAIAVPGSEYAMCVEIDLFGNQVRNKEISAVQDMMKHLGLDMPVEILQKK